MIGEYALNILAQKFGNADWIHQAVTAIALGADRAIRQLSQLGVEQNQQPFEDGGDYVMPARTREELIATEHLAANSGHVPREAKKRHLQDPAAVITTNGVPVIQGIMRRRQQVVQDAIEQAQVVIRDAPPKDWLM